MTQSGGWGGSRKRQKLTSHTTTYEREQGQHLENILDPPTPEPPAAHADDFYDGAQGMDVDVLPFQGINIAAEVSRRPRRIILEHSAWKELVKKLVTPYLALREHGPSRPSACRFACEGHTHQVMHVSFQGIILVVCPSPMSHTT